MWPARLAGSVPRSNHDVNSEVKINPPGEESDMGGVATLAAGWAVNSLSV